MYSAGQWIIKTARPEAAALPIQIMRKQTDSVIVSWKDTALPASLSPETIVTSALPVADAGAVLNGKIRDLVEKLTPKTANHVKQELLSLITAS
mgnify:CR=1 FL=1